MRILLLTLLIAMACSKKEKLEAQISSANEDLVAILDAVFLAEQIPIRARDSLMDIYGVESEEAQVQQLIYEQNHVVNEQKVREILDRDGWPDKEVIGEQGNITICAVIQHADNEIRIKYLPMMRQAVIEKNLNPRFLVRAEDRIATERGDLQIYGGQMKYYPETKSFNVWPVYDPININKRRAEIGLGTIEEHLRNRFDFEWDLDEQLKRTAEFERVKNSATE